ncbi:MAG: sugar ABC transporter permease [Aggregatilineales bacterium]
MQESLQSDLATTKVITEPTLWQMRFRKLIPYLFILPAFILFISLRYVPAFSAIYHSFTQWNGVRAPEFVGLENYVRLLQDDVFIKAMTNMIIYTLARTTMVVFMAFVAAELVLRVPSVLMQSFWKIVFIIPLIVPNTVNLLVWGFVYNTQNGILNEFLESIGLASLRQPWLGQSSTALGAIIFIGFPFVASFAFLIYVSALQSMPSEVLDAARVDGCNFWRRLIYIDVPLMKGPITLTVILLVIEGINLLQPQLVLTRGGPGVSTESPAHFLYLAAFQNRQFGYASAVGVIMLIVGLGFSIYSIYLRYKGAADVNV